MFYNIVVLVGISVQGKCIFLCHQGIYYLQVFMNVALCSISFRVLMQTYSLVLWCCGVMCQSTLIGLFSQKIEKDQSIFFLIFSSFFKKWKSVLIHSFCQFVDICFSKNGKGLVHPNYIIFGPFSKNRLFYNFWPIFKKRIWVSPSFFSILAHF